MPNTSNIVLEIPTTGSLSGTWGDQALNPNFVALDGMLGGVVTVSLSNAPVTLTAPSGSVTPTAGPYQSQNAIINLTGTLTANVQVTLPLPGVQRVANFATGNFTVTLRAAGSGEVVGLPAGTVTEVFNDGTNVKFITGSNVPPGTLSFMAGFVTYPLWINACTIKPYLACDGTVSNFSDYPHLAAIFGGSFGGNGITTFAVPDLRGRVPLALDSTSARITVAGCGINGNVLGASGGAQNITLTTAMIPSITPAGTINTPTIATNTRPGSVSGNGQIYAVDAAFSTGLNSTVSSLSAPLTFTGTPFGGGQAHNNVQPSQVCGMWFVKT